MSKTKIYEKIELTIIALCIIFVISIISYNKEIPLLTSANYEKTIGWGIKRENNHLQPDVGSKNKQILEENNGICMGRDGEKIIYLTFDSGYEAGYMDKILTTLKENNVKATFFITAHYLNSATEEVEKMVAAIEESGWDGEWFLRAYDADGNKVGSKECEEGQIYIEPQGFCVLAGVGVENGLAKKALDSVKEKLATKYGIVLLQPTYTKYYVNLGEISSYPP